MRHRLSCAAFVPLAMLTIGLSVLMPSATALARTGNPTAKIVIDEANLPGYTDFGQIADLATPSYRACFKTNSLLSKVPPEPPSGTGGATSNHSATVGASFTQGSLAVNEERDVASIAWYGDLSAEVRSAFAALTGATFIECLDGRLVKTAGSVGEPATMTTSGLAGPPIHGGGTGANRLTETVYSNAAGIIRNTYEYDLTVVRIGRMVALLETDAGAGGAPSQLEQFSETQRLGLALIMADRMAKVQGLHQPQG